MNERERMIQGQIYDPGVPELIKEQIVYLDRL